MNIDWSAYAAFSPEFLLAVSGLILLVIGVFRGNESFRLVSWLSLIVYAGAAFLVACVADGERQALFSGMFVMDGFGQFVKILILGGLAVSTLLSLRYAEAEKIARFEYPVLVLMSGLGMMVMVSANNLITAYIGLELQSLSLYVLAAQQTQNSRSSEAGIKYFVLGALASGMLLFGSSLVYGYAGGLDFDVIAASISAGEAPAGAENGATLTLRRRLVERVRGEVVLVDAGSLPNDGLVIEDRRPVE